MSSQLFELKLSKQNYLFLSRFNLENLRGQNWFKVFSTEYVVSISGAQIIPMQYNNIQYLNNLTNKTAIKQYAAPT